MTQKDTMPAKTAASLKALKAKREKLRQRLHAAVEAYTAANTAHVDACRLVADVERQIRAAEEK